MLQETWNLYSFPLLSCDFSKSILEEKHIFIGFIGKFTISSCIKTEDASFWEIIYKTWTFICTPSFLIIWLLRYKNISRTSSLLWPQDLHFLDSTLAPAILMCKQSFPLKIWKASPFQVQAVCWFSRQDLQNPLWFLVSRNSKHHGWLINILFWFAFAHPQDTFHLWESRDFNCIFLLPSTLPFCYPLFDSSHTCSGLRPACMLSKQGPQLVLIFT